MLHRGFTLAEVLITLGIIGVVAAMTLPALVNQTQGKELETGLQKAYSVIQAALNQMAYDEGQTINITNYPTHTFMPIFKKYFKITKDCGTVGCETLGTSDDGKVDYSSKNYKTYNNKKLQNAFFDDGQAIASDGMLILIENNSWGLVREFSYQLT